MNGRISDPHLFDERLWQAQISCTISRVKCIFKHLDPDCKMSYDVLQVIQFKSRNLEP